MTLQFTLGAVDATIAYLKASFAAEVTLMNTEYGADGYAISAPVNADYYLYEPLGNEAFPYVIVLPETVSAALTTDGPGEMRVRHDLSIIIADRNTDEVATARKIDKYARAVVEMLKKGRGVLGNTVAAQNNPYVIEWGSPLVQFTDAHRSEDAPTLQRAIIRVGLHRQEVLS